MSWRRALVALVWTALWVPIVFFTVSFSMLGDCTQDIITGDNGPCMNQQRVVGWLIVAIGLVTLLAGYWVIFRRRRR